MVAWPGPESANGHRNGVKTKGPVIRGYSNENGVNGADNYREDYGARSMSAAAKHGLCADGCPCAVSMPMRLPFV